MHKNIVPAKHENPHAVALRRLSAKKGDVTRAQRLTPERRQEIAILEAKAGGRNLSQRFRFLE
jgi:hypothetical protein